MDIKKGLPGKENPQRGHKKDQGFSPGQIKVKVGVLK
jgi:hypothetical protein